MTRYGGISGVGGGMVVRGWCDDRVGVCVCAVAGWGGCGAAWVLYDGLFGEVSTRE